MFRSHAPSRAFLPRVAPPGEPRPESTREASRVALLVVHGMGQQVRFETLDGVAKSLLAGAGVEAPGRAAPLAVRFVEHDGQWFPRAELELPLPGGGARDVHLYEAYWAPLTEGRIRTLEVFDFLVASGLAAARHAAFAPHGEARFSRYMFGDWQRWRVPWTAAAKLAALVLLLVAIAAADAVALAALFSRLLAAGFAAHAPAGALAAGAALLALSIPLRSFLHEYVGDVVIYVSSYKVNRFYETRDAIQKTALDVARCVYDLRDAGGRPAYARVVVVGHSLGSVIAYDTLNAVLRSDPDPLAPAGPVARTGALVTFGSPLDKTAFVFRTQKRVTSEVREALAEAVQPLIQDYRFRPPRWINLWSPNDPVSGALQYYDLDDEHRGEPGAAATQDRRVRNLIDGQARTPGLAHEQYWRNALLARVLYQEVTRD